MGSLCPLAARRTSLPKLCPLSSLLEPSLGIVGLVFDTEEQLGAMG